MGQFTSRISLGQAGNQGNGPSNSASISANGRYVVFASSANNLGGPDAALEDIFLRDTLLGVTTRISVTSTGAPATDYSMGPSVSANGRQIAFYSFAALVPGGGAGCYVRDLDSGQTIAASVNSDGVFGAELAGFYLRTSISADGRFVAFCSTAGDLVDGDVGYRDVFVHDRDADLNGVFDESGAIKTVRVSVSSKGVAGTGNSRHPEMSPDGRFVVFDSDVSTLVEGDTNNAPDIFLHDRDPDGDQLFDEPGQIETTLVSVNTAGQQANTTGTWWGTMSSDARYIAYHSDASSLVSNDTNGTYDIFIRDRVEGTTWRISVTPTYQQTPDHSGFPKFSANGRYVTFLAFGDSMMANDNNGGEDIVVYDRLTHSCSLANVTTAGMQGGPIGGTSAHFAPSISADGRYVTMCSTAFNLVPNDFNGVADVFLRDRGSVNIGDITGNGVVNVEDLLAVISAWGPCPAPCPADVTPPGGNGIVNVEDLLTIISHWG